MTQTPAFDPAASVFVSANAGSGKTRLLTNRVLSLLLHGVNPSHILCLTFTNAASAEMESRILKELGKWVMADELSLHASLAELLGTTPNTTMTTRARGLFAHVLEAPEGVRIQTIHGFCQSLLRRFPIEAAISAHFTVIDERTEQELLAESRLRLFNRANQHDPELQEAVSELARALSESGFQTILSEIVKNRRRFANLFHQAGGAEAAIHQLWRAIGLPPHTTHDHLLAEHFDYDEAVLAMLRQLPDLLLQGAVTDCATGRALAGWLESTDQRSAMAADYIRAFITNDDTKRARLFTKKTLTDDSLIDALLQEQDRVMRFHEARKALDVARFSAHLLHLADALLALYEAQKSSRSLMDYDDLILTAIGLLERPGIAPWVLFKLDGGIDHILVDEAQDTSPEQWRIIHALTQDFFSGDSRKDIERSLFVVGDEKQSIYSFQGADPAALGEMQRYFTARIGDAGKPAHSVKLLHSYRSTREVLAAVDAVFAPEPARAGLTDSGEPFTHILTRDQHPGLVEVWPLVRPVEDSHLSHGALLARSLAGTIKSWLDSGMMLEAKNRPLRAGDIMILVRHRNSLVDKLVRALKRAGVPVAGVDRMALNDNLAVQDLLALGQCLLLPEDELTLAGLLKSPVCNIDEEALFELAYARGTLSLWERLRQFAQKPPFTDAYAMLSDLRGRTDFLSPFELYSYALDILGARARITGRMGEEYNDPIDEFLHQTLLYERAHTPSLQGFIHWLSGSNSQIKRDMEQSGNAVRILTVHGAKGLQAPVVILPDTTQVPLPHDVILWHGQLALWPVSSRRDNDLCRNLRAGLRQAMLAEQKRLLYVALTRAEDRLYICGSTGKEAVNEQSWYGLVSAGLAGIAQPFATGEGEGLRLGIPLPVVGGQTKIPNPASPHPLNVYVQPPTGEGINYSFLHRPPPADPLPPRPLAPSHVADDQPAASSPLMERYSYPRGNFIHTLLQHLSQTAPGARLSVTETVCSLYRRDLPEKVMRQAVTEVNAILNAPEFSFLFDDVALAEVPITGCVEVNGMIVTVSGQIDRLTVSPDAVWIVDFKSNRLPPQDMRDIPPAYIRQLRLYRLLMRQIYPDRAVHCALLWTSAPKLTVIGDALLD